MQREPRSGIFADISTIPARHEGERASLSDDARAVLWRYAVGAAAGVVAGALIGGIGGRVVMLILRLSTSQPVDGVLSDDGFEMGRITFDTLSLIGLMALAGALNGVLYVTIRDALPARLRAPLWALFAAALGGALVIDPEGVDFTLLEPRPFAVASFIALPALAALAVSVLVERGLRTRPWPGRRRSAGVALVALGGTAALVPSAAVAALALAVRRTPAISETALRVGRVVVPLVLLAGIAIGSVEIVRDARDIL